jgi:hypothetical protein
MEGLNCQSKSSKRFEGAEVGGGGAALEQALLAHVQLILEDEFEELAVAEPAGGRFGQAHVEALGQAGEPELAQGRLEWSHKVSGWRSSAGVKR